VGELRFSHLSGVSMTSVSNGTRAHVFSAASRKTSFYHLLSSLKHHLDSEVSVSPSVK
jgi:hypothetical protein